jgi:hypothetical protein
MTPGKTAGRSTAARRRWVLARLIIGPARLQIAAERT